VFRATGIRLSELAGIHYVPDDPERNDLDLMHREIRVYGKGGKVRIVRIGHEAARSVDRYLRLRVSTSRRTARNCGSGSTTGCR